MHRRRFLAAVAAAGSAGTAGCGALGSRTRLSNPTVDRGEDGEGSLHWSAGGRELAHLGVSPDVGGGVLDVSTEIWHRSGTDVTGVTLGVWLTGPDGPEPADVAVVAPVTGDSSPPPSLSLDRRPGGGTLVELTDLDDLADETIATLDLLVRPRSTAATTLVVEGNLAVTERGLLGSRFRATGRLDLSVPGLADA